MTFPTFQAVICIIATLVSAELLAVETFQQPHEQFAAESILADELPTPIAQPGTNASIVSLLGDLQRPLLFRDHPPTNSATSCSAANCHGGPNPGIARPTAARGSEYQLWFEHDPHAQSWRTMCSSESIAILEKLRILQDGQIRDPAGYNNCLACHNSSKLPPTTVDQRTDAHATVAANQISVNFNREGVGCTSCHGPSFQWIGTHFQHDWTVQSTDEKIGEGFVSLGNIVTRARVCASCHVGDSDRDMNHDIIAAGHPPLRYEFATYHQDLPKHWRDLEATDQFTFEPTLWLAGQIAGVDAFLAALESRCQKSLHVSQWPEFAAYDCASCHHELGLENRRPVREENTKGIPTFSRWYDTGLIWVLEQAIADGHSHSSVVLLEKLSSLREHMHASAIPDSILIAKKARQARRALGQWSQIDSQEVLLSWNGKSLSQIISVASTTDGAFITWESAAQFYLAVVAAREHWSFDDQAGTKHEVDRLRSGLGFPDKRNIYATHKFDPPRLNRAEATKLGREISVLIGE
ncbi:MAG: hypothetical protein KDB27_06225 [Planctomycetales bacterium]|nr:hypothetical protein [Planctomycetales bacterium]